MKVFLILPPKMSLVWSSISYRSKVKSSSLVCLLVRHLGRVRTRRQSSGSVGGASPSVVDSRGRSRAKVVSQSQPGSRSSSPGKLLGQSSYGRIPRAMVSTSSTPVDKRSRIPRSQGCSRETSPSRLGLGRTRALA
ncbi:CLIP-associating protein 1-A [Ameca splendens]|uniref:CLIP-associating protein 1-A n=1 Tax=Ameca splendens TaxID=208324 RepID=A0ABV1A4L4_9TELE